MQKRPYRKGDVVWAKCISWNNDDDTNKGPPTGETYYVGPVTITWHYSHTFDPIVYSVKLPSFVRDGDSGRHLVTEEQISKI